MHIYPYNVVTTCSLLFTLEVPTISLRLTPVLLSLHLTIVHMSSRYNLWAFITFLVHFLFPFRALVLVAVHLIFPFTFLYLVRVIFNMSHGLPARWKMVIFYPKGGISHIPWCFAATFCLLSAVERAFEGFEGDFQRREFQDAAHPR